jgi:hypothetical protein
MNPLRWDVLLAGFVLSLPVLALGLRGDLTLEEVMVRLLWCLAAGWGAMALLRYASTPRTAPVPKAHPVPASLDAPAEDGEHSPAT